MTNPYVRLIGRALVTGITTALVLWQNGGGDAWKGAIVAGVLAALEILTPLNAVVGVGKEKP